MDITSDKTQWIVARLNWKYIACTGMNDSLYPRAKCYIYNFICYLGCLDDNVCVSVAKCAPENTFCSRSYRRSSFEYLARFLYVCPSTVLLLKASQPCKIQPWNFTGVVRPRGEKLEKLLPHTWHPWTTFAWCSQGTLQVYSWAQNDDPDVWPLNTECWCNKR